MNRREFGVLSAAAAAAMMVDRGTARAEDRKVSVTVHPDHALGLLPPRGLGFSGEKHLICAGRFYTPGNRDFTAICKRLGPQVLRIGGTHVDHTIWESSGTGGVEGKISPADVKSFAEYVKLIGWKVVYGVNMATTPPGDTADEARVAASYLGDSLLAFEIGNEPDLYVLHKDREPGYNYATFLKEWKEFAGAIRGAVPRAPLSGPGAYMRWREYGLPFVRDEGANILLLTQHYYRMGGDKPGATMDALLDGMPALFVEMQGMVDAASRNKIPYGFRMIETNSFVGGGLPGVSERMVCGLWAVEYALKAAEMGVNGLNFQIGPQHSTNSPVAMGKDPNVTAVRPEFYGMAMVADMGHGQMLQTDLNGAPARVSAHAMDTSKGERNVVLINMTDQDVPGVRIDTSCAASSADAMWFTGGKLLSAECTLGGTKIGNDAQGEAKWSAVQGSAGGFTMDLPSASAVRLRMMKA